MTRKTANGMIFQNCNDMYVFVCTVFQKVV